jgi:pyrroline-5-carboxylate reductase
MQNEVVLAAIPSSAIKELAARFPGVKQFDGTLILTGTDLSLEEARHFTPQATVLRVAPFLLPGREDIPSLVLYPDGLPDERKAPVEALLLLLGPVDGLCDESAFEVAMCLGSPLPVVLLSALRKMTGDALAQQGVSPASREISERTLLRALSSIATASLAEAVKTGEREVATPGGITEAGLRHAGDLSTAMNEIVKTMLQHARRQRTK